MLVLVSSTSPDDTVCISWDARARARDCPVILVEDHSSLIIAERGSECPLKELSSTETLVRRMMLVVLSIRHSACLGCWEGCGGGVELQRGRETTMSGIPSVVACGERDRA